MQNDQISSRQEYLDSVADGLKYPSEEMGHPSAVEAKETILSEAIDDQQATAPYVSPLLNAQQVPIVGSVTLKYSGTIREVEPIMIAAPNAMIPISRLTSFFAPTS